MAGVFRSPGRLVQFGRDGDTEFIEKLDAAEHDGPACHGSPHASAGQAGEPGDRRQGAEARGGFACYRLADRVLGWVLHRSGEQ